MLLLHRLDALHPFDDLNTLDLVDTLSKHIKVPRELM